MSHRMDGHFVNRTVGYELRRTTKVAKAAKAPITSAARAMPLPRHSNVRPLRTAMLARTKVPTTPTRTTQMLVPTSP